MWQRGLKMEIFLPKDKMTTIKCECGNKFEGWADKEDTCPSCLKSLMEEDNKIELIQEKANKPKTFNVRWGEEVFKSIDVEAESKEEAERMFTDNEIDESEAHTDDVNFIEDSLEVEEVEE